MDTIGRMGSVFTRWSRRKAADLCPLIGIAYDGQPLAGANDDSFAANAHAFFSTIGIEAQNIGLERLDGRDSTTILWIAQQKDNLGLAYRNGLKSMSIFALTGLDYSSRNVSDVPVSQPTIYQQYIGGEVQQQIAIIDQSSSQNDPTFRFFKFGDDQFDDELFGQSNDDHLFGGEEGEDTVNGGKGDDSYNLSGTGTVTIEDSAGADT